MGRPPGRTACFVCTSVSEADLIELNLLLGDPANWPREIVKRWNIPDDVMPRHVRTWGAAQIGIEWLAARGIEATNSQVRHHFRNHVAHIVASEQEMIEVARMNVPDNVAANRDILPALRPRLYVDYYSKGIQLGIYALDQLKTRILAMIERGEEVPMTTLWRLADLGAKLAATQAALAARRGRSSDVEDDDEIGGFRDGSAPLPSQRFGDHRIRVIEGESRPIVDRGKADRATYNERAAGEGSPKLPD